MSSVSRRESHSQASTDLPVPHPESDGTPSQVSASTSKQTGRSPGKQETPATGAGSNQVEIYRGAVEPPRAQGAGTPLGGMGEGGGLTAGQLALGGARRADAARAEAAYADIKASLHTDWKDRSITDADRRRVHEQLEKLPPADYRQMLERMEQDKLLGKYLDLEQMSPEQRSAFLAQAERKGCVTREPVRKAPFAPCQPPDVPTLYKNDAKLPASVRESVHESNRLAKRTYHDAHDAYVKRYSEQVMQARSLLDIRALGEPVAPFKVSDGLVYPHPDYNRFRASWSAVPGNDTRDDAYEAVANRMADLSGRMRPGSFWFKAAAEVKAEFMGMEIKGGVEALVTQDGRTDWAPKGGVERGIKGVTVGVENSESGEPKVSVGLEHELHSPKGKDPMTVGISVDSDGGLRADLPVGGGFGSYVELNQKQGTYGGGVGFERKFGKTGEEVKVKVEVGFGMQGMRQERARDVASTQPGTLFGALPELDQGLAWKDIPTERRERMERDGMTPELWREALRRKGVFKR
ncbi:hypothetical protein [Archangium sp.]|uniref:hypothetical protein n=1 Tax=Archangium sp. TaxID=1872627 RepID=UPI002ED8DAD8